MSDEHVTIYALSDETGIRYIGQTRQAPAARLKQHVGARLSGGAALLEWIAQLRARGVMPTISVIDVVAEDRANDVEQAHIAAHRARGCALVNASGGGYRRPRLLQRPALTWSCMVRLTAQAGEEIERMARREGVSASMVARRLVAERLDRMVEE